MMATVISLREVVEAMEVLSDNCVSYLDPDTDEIAFWALWRTSGPSRKVEEAIGFLRSMR